MATDESSQNISPSSLALSKPKPQNPNPFDYMGSFITLFSNRGLRYEGFLYHLNPNDKTLCLVNVICYGTEDRTINGFHVPPFNEVYRYIIFRATQIKEALPDILEKTPKEFFDKKNKAMRRNVEHSLERLKDIPCLICPKKPESCSYLWLKLDTSMLDSIKSDFDFCAKLVNEESLVLVPGVVLRAKNWVRISIGTEESELDEIFDRLKRFFDRHAVPKENVKLNGLTINQRVVSVT